MPSGAFWGALMGGIGESAQKEQARRRTEEDQQRQLEIGLLAKIPMEELDPYQQRTLLERQLQNIYGKKLDPRKGHLAALSLFDSLQPRAPEDTPPLTSLPAPPGAQGALDGGSQPSWEMGPTGDADMPGLEPMPVPITPGAFPAAASQAPMIRASPGQARPRKFGMWGPSYAQKEEIKTEHDLAREQQRGVAAIEARANERRKMLDLIPTLPPEYQGPARVAILTGQMPSTAAPHVSALETTVVDLTGPNGEEWSGQLKDAIPLMSAGWLRRHSEARDSATEQRREEGIQQIMTATGMTRPQAGIEYYKRLERKQQMENANLGARTSFFQRSATEPSSGERTDVTQRQQQIAGILKEARTFAQGLGDFRTPQGRQFYMTTKKTAPGEADIRQAELQFAEQALEDLGLNPDEVQAAMQSVRSRFGPAPAGGAVRGPTAPAGGAVRGPKAFIPPR